MPEQHKNRLHSFWPKLSSSAEAGGADAAAPLDANMLAARLEPIVENVGHAIATHPRTSLGIAAALGAALGWFIKRK
jgi:ElaB/YqjD/DUF883 family membrane-anchored ribosome-binding protein